MEELIVKDICKTYVINKRQNHVLCNVSFQVKEGELTAIMGPSGSGKSTLLYTVSGMDTPTAGTVEFFGKKLSGLPAGQMSKLRLDEMGFIFQQMYMLRNLNIFDNIVLPAYQSDKEKKRAKIKERAERLMRKLGIMEIADNDINEVSGGQLQRACICRSLINQPKMIFADEPTGALNRQASNGVMDEISRIHEEGTTVLLVTHDSRVASRCGRILYLEDGGVKGELRLPPYEKAREREREQKVINWLSELGW